MVVLVIVFSVTLANAGNKTETIKFTSYTVSTYEDMVDGLDGAKSVKLKAKLVIPPGDDKRPAIVFIHDQGGLRPRNNYWLTNFQKMGIATLQLDCYKARGVSGTDVKSSKVRSMVMATDALKALEALSNHPDIDSNRIGVMGVCVGGVASISTAWEPVRKAVIKSDLKFAANISLYPLCYDFEEFDFSGAPILILSGGKDTWVPTETCVDFAANLKATGYPVKTIVYPEAYHLFDAEYSLKNASFYNAFNCRFKMQPNGVLLNTKCNLDSRDSNYIKCCVKKSKIKYGKNKKVKEQALVEVKSFISKVFQIEMPTEESIASEINTKSSSVSNSANER
ncbi:MAG: hypothetical protein HN921_05330 [Bacteroidetes bacterium]|nr:hypothetical protein [Bacteroidota bacterium]